MDNVKYYASKKAQGKPLPSAGEEDDPLQMGGDFTFRWVHRSDSDSVKVLKYGDTEKNKCFDMKKLHYY